MKFYFKLRFIWTFITYAFYPHFLKLGTQFVMYYKLRCNSTQFVIYYKLRNYYKLQRNSAASQQRTLTPPNTWSCLMWDLHICSNVETIYSWTFHVYGPFEFRTSLGTSILLRKNTTRLEKDLSQYASPKWDGRRCVEDRAFPFSISRPLQMFYEIKAIVI